MTLGYHICPLTIGYAASFGPLTWLVTAELFPVSVRGRALGYSEVVTMASAWLVSHTCLSGQDILGPAVPFAFYFVCTMITLIFIIIAVPDAGSASTSADDSDLSIMEYEMSQMWLWNNEKRCSVFQLPSATELIASDNSCIFTAVLFHEPIRCFLVFSSSSNSGLPFNM